MSMLSLCVVLGAAVAAAEEKYTQQELDVIFGLTPGTKTNWVQCSRYECPLGEKYEVLEGGKLKEWEVTTCAKSENVFSKYYGGWMLVNGKRAYNSEQFCKAKGYDRVGRIWRGMPVTADSFTDITQMALRDDLKIALCNDRFLHYQENNYHLYYAFTFECIEAIKTPAGCCTNWKGMCYSQRRLKQNNFRACGIVGGIVKEEDGLGSGSGFSWQPDCYEECGGGPPRDYPFKAAKEDSKACGDCCQELAHGNSGLGWNCDKIKAPPGREEVAGVREGTSAAEYPGDARSAFIAGGLAIALLSVVGATYKFVSGKKTAGRFDAV